MAVVLGFLLASAAAGCVANTFADPRIIAGGETTVSIKGGSWRSAEPLAKRYCRQFGREAVATGGGSITYDQLTSLYTFDCVDKRP